MHEFRGIPVSSGIAIGRALLLDDARPRIVERAIEAAAVPDELDRLERALDKSVADLDTLRADAERALGKEAAAIFAFHQGMLRDPSLIQPIRDRISTNHVAAEWATQQQFEDVARMFSSMGDTAFSTKVDDVWDLFYRVLRHLMGRATSVAHEIDEPSIVVAADLTPSQAAAFADSEVLGFVTGLGGPTSHTAIFARALGIPACVGARGVTTEVETGELIIVDGETGLIVIDPDEATLEHFEQIRKSRIELSVRLTSDALLDSRTTDGEPIALMGNIEFGHESKGVVTKGGAGVGLFRTEFLWLTMDHEPSEEEQFDQYKEAVEGANGLPVTIRTCDLGADKFTQAAAAIPERNPFLGLRSIRYSLKNLPALKVQLRAILRASAIGPVRVMFPLITQMPELRHAKLVLRDVMEDLDDERIAYDRSLPVGMMVEAPSAAVMASSFARECDFFSIGTNDLVQYTLAVDRTNERVAELYSPVHPAVMRLMKDVVRAARRHKTDVSICGEMAGDPTYTMLLIGIGLRTLSATPARIPYLKRVVRSVSVAECERLARTVGSFDSEGQVATYLLDQARKRFPELVGGRSADDGGSR